MVPQTDASVSEAGLRMADYVPNADFVLIEEASHISNVYTTEVFTTQMLGFLEHT